MARVEYSSIVNEIKGSIKGTSFQRNKSGTIAKGKSVLVFNPSVNQLVSQSDFNYVVGLWAALTFANKELWIAFALANTKFNYWNEEKTLSGFNWFVSLNSNRLLTGQALFTAPPAYATPLFCPEFNLNVAAESLDIEFVSFPTASDYYLFIFATPPLRSVNLQSRRHLRLISVIAPSSAESHEITAAWESYFNLVYPSSTVSNSYQILAAVSCVDSVTGIAGQFWLANNYLSL